MALTDKLTAIGNAIREKTGGTDLLTLDQMPTEIANIQGGGTVEELTITSNGTYNPPAGIDGYAPVVVNVPQNGGPPESALHITDDCYNMFSGKNWNWFIETYGNQITTSDISSCLNMFSDNSTIISVPFEINTTGYWQYFNNMFKNCRSLINPPRININSIIDRLPSLQYMFQNCYNLRNIDYDYFSHWFNEEQWNTINNNMYGGDQGYLFENCYSLRKHPDISMLCFRRNTNNIYNHLFYKCYTLNEILDLPITTADCSDSIFDSPWGENYMLKNLTFKTNSDGTPKTANWSNQSIYIDMGFVSNTSYIFDYNSGITADKEVKDDATYQALKDDPDWFSCDYNYSRYNHDSAVRTINSLPDTSAFVAIVGGTNTISFWGQNGALTDGGAVNTLTEEEIAVATAKGWTVSLV